MADIDRIVTLIDMDCFYCQVEEKYNPSLKGKPVAVVQYNQWKGGGIIAVNYEARARGVTRHMRGDEAKEKCPDIQLPQVPSNRGKADISKYRQAGKEVSDVLQEFTPLLERASVDEAYLDITKQVTDRIASYRNKNSINMEPLSTTYVLGYESLDNYIKDVYKETHCEDINFDQERCLRLLVGAIIVSEIRAAVYEKTGYKCSAGIAHNKIIAKLVCGMNKPNKQTLLPLHCIPILFESLPVSKIRSLGGKFGEEVCQTLGIVHMKDLMRFTEKELQKHFEEKNGSWLYNIARGIDTDPVVPRLCSKSIGCCKKFPGVTAITESSVLTHWLNELSLDLEERVKTDMIENNRYPTQLVVHFIKEISAGRDISCTRSFNFKRGSKLEAKFYAETAVDVIKKDSKPFLKSQSETDGVLTHPIKHLGLTVGKFEENLSPKSKIVSFFTGNTASLGKPSNDQTEDDPMNSTSPSPKDFEMPDTDEPKAKMSRQESFFVNYFKNPEPHSSGAETVLKDSEIDNKSLTVGDCFTVRRKSVRDSDEQCDSDDSIGTIDLEIRTSKRLFEPKEEPCTERPGLGEAFSKQAEGRRLPNEMIPPPLIKPQVRQFINCEECKKNILSNEFSLHLDYHLALSLRLDDERTVSLERKPKQSPMKSNRSADNDRTVPTIKDYFKTPPANYEYPDTELCMECGKHIKLIEYAEHLDYHEAKKLSIELNSNRSLNLNCSESSSTTVKRKKSVSPTSSNKKMRKDSRTKSIDSFFK